MRGADLCDSDTGRNPGGDASSRKLEPHSFDSHIVDLVAARTRIFRRWVGLDSCICLHYVGLSGWECLPINLDIVEEAYSLPEPFHADPVDRLLVATARIHGLHLITGDEKKLLYPHVHTIW